MSGPGPRHLGVATNTLDYDTVEVASGGVVIGTTIVSAGDRPFGGELLVYGAGAATNTMVSSGGSFGLWDNSVASNTTVICGDFGVGSGGTAITTVSGGMFELGSGAVASATTVLSGGWRWSTRAPSAAISRSAGAARK